MNLIEVGLQDQLQNQSTCSQKQIAHLYAIALIRFVNGFIDHAQKGPFASSALSIAKCIGLPAWFVEIRHQCTHDKVPGLYYLRQCKDQALDWLYHSYWIIQANAFELSSKRALEWTSDYFSISDSLVLNHATDPNQVVQNALATLSTSFNNDTWPAIIPQLASRISSFNCSKKVEKKKWSLLLTSCQLNWPEFCKLFLESMIESLFKKEKTRENDCKVIEFVKEKYSSFLYIQVELIEDVIKYCLAEPTHFSVFVAQEMAVFLDNPSHRYHLLIKHASLSLSCHQDEATYVLESKKVMDNDSKDVEQKSSDSSCLWTLDNEWSACPIGCLSGSLTVPDLSLDACFDNMGWLNENGLLFIPLPHPEQQMDNNNVDSKQGYKINRELLSELSDKESATMSDQEEDDNDTVEECIDPGMIQLF